MKKYIAAGAAALVLVSAAAVGTRASGIGGSAQCAPPLTIFDHETNDAARALEEYLSANVAPKVKNSADLSWQSADYSPTLKPGVIAVDIAVGTGYADVHYYHVKLVRDCQGGDWKVVEFKQFKS